MRFANPYIRASAPLALALLLIASSCMGEEDVSGALVPLSRSISGLWEVGAVSTYPSEDFVLAAAQAREPRIRHRLVRFSDAELSVDASRGLRCATPRSSKRTLPMPELVAQSFSGEMGMAVPFFESEDVVEALYLACDGKPLRIALDGDGVERDVWMFVKGDRAYLRWYDASVLWLERVDESAPAQASFACAKAQAATEKSICASRALAGYDRSVSEAYDRWLAQHATDDPETRSEREKIVADQRAWIRERNACGADAACLTKSMQARIDALIHEVEKDLSAEP